MEAIDANTMGRAGYDLLIQQHIIPAKSKLELTQEDKLEISKKLQKFLMHNTSLMSFDNIDTAEQMAENNKSMFMGILISSVIAYVNDVDVNKFISIKPKNIE